MPEPWLAQRLGVDYLTVGTFPPVADNDPWTEKRLPGEQPLGIISGAGEISGVRWLICRGADGSLHLAKWSLTELLMRDRGWIDWSRSETRVDSFLEYFLLPNSSEQTKPGVNVELSNRCNFRAHCTNVISIYETKDCKKKAVYECCKRKAHLPLVERKRTAILTILQIHKRKLGGNKDTNKILGILFVFV